jgi:hypothetical protein
MALNMLEIRRVSKCRHIPVQIPQPTMDRRIRVTDHAFVGFEQAYIDRIKADDGDVEADVDFGDLRAKVVRTGVVGREEMLLNLVEVGEEVVNGGFVGCLGGGETALAISKVGICLCVLAHRSRMDGLTRRHY